MLKQYTNFGGEKVELPEVMKYHFENAVVEIHGIDAADCREALKRIDNPHKLTHDVYMCAPKLAEYYQKHK